MDCGLAIQVCASSVDATCTNLGLPEKGSSVPKVEVSQGETSTTTPKDVISTAVTPSPSTLLGKDSSTTETSSSGKDSMSTASTSTTETGASTSDTSQGESNLVSHVGSFLLLGLGFILSQ